MTSTAAHPIDSYIFAISLAITLLLGLSYGRSVKTLKEYAIGGKNFSTSALVATIIATWITGRFLTWRIEDIYHNGLYAISLYLCDVGTLLITAWVFAMRMGPFLGKTSIAEAMGDLYGRPIRAITAIFGLLVSIGLVALQFKTGERIFSALLGWDSTYTQVFIGTIIIIYSSLGGIRAVTFTDVIQFFTFGTLIPILTLAVWNSVRGFDKVFTLFQSVPHFNLDAFLDPSYSGRRWKFLTLIPLYLVPAFSPPIFQRVAIAKNVQQVRKSFLYAASIYFLLLLFIMWIAVVIRANHNSLEPGDVLPYIVSNYVPVGLAGMLLAGLMAMIMSTADSNLNAASVIFADEFATTKLFGSRSRVAALQKDESVKLSMARCANVLLGLFALYLSLHPKSYLFTNLVLKAWNFYMPVVSVPLLLAILGFRSTTTPVLIGMGLGFVTVVVWNDFIPYSHIDGSMPGMLAHCLGLLGSHYLLKAPGGWQSLEASSPLALERTAHKQVWRRRFQAIRSFKLPAYLRRNLPAEESFYFFFGLYTMTATYVTFYTIVPPEDINHRTLYHGVYYTVLPIATFFLTLPIWPPEIKKARFMAYLWPLGIGMVLFFAGTLLVVMNHFHHIQVMIMMINFLMAVLLLHWPLALFLALAGASLAVFFFEQYTGSSLPLDQLGPSQFKLLYGLLLFTSFLIALVRGKQAYSQLSTSYRLLSEERAASSVELLDALHHRERLVQEVVTDKKDAIVSIKQAQQALNEELKEAKTREQLLAVTKDLSVIADKIHVLIDYLDQVTYQTQGYMRLEVSTVSLSKFLQDVFSILSAQNKVSAQQIIVQQNTTCEAIQADIEKIKQLLVDSLYYAQRRKQEGESVLLRIEETSLGYPINTIPGHVKEVRALYFGITTEKTMRTPSTLYMVSVDRGSIHLPRDTTELPITHNQQITEAHYGAFELIETPHGITQIYVIPVLVREVRPQAMDLLDRPRKTVAPDSTVDPAEAAFVRAIQDKTSVDMPLLEKALRLIKKYHAGVMRKSGEPFYLHPIAVAQILLDYTQDQDILLAALLHDTVEDTKLSLAQIALYFNEAVKTVVDGVTHLESSLKHFKRVQLSAYENMLQLLKIKDERVLYVKLADRLHNMRTIEGHTSLEKQKKIAEETLQFFVPMARGLALEPIAGELKELSLVVLKRT